MKMKQSTPLHTILLVVLCLLLSSCSAKIKTYSLDDVHYENGLWVDAETNEPITGEFNTVDSSVIKQRSLYKNGKLHGIERNYYESGTLESENTYVNGELDGENRAYYEIGVLKSSRPFSNGKAHGVWREYNESGVLTSEESYLNDKRDGITTYYHDSGAVSMVATYVEGDEHGITHHYSETGHLEREESYDHGKQNGPNKLYFKSGALRAEFYYRGGKFSGKWTKYFETGSIRRQFVFDPDPKHRESFTFKTFYRSGNIRSEGSVVEGQLQESRKYHESGELAVEAVFENGNLVNISGPTGESRATLLQYFAQPNCDIKPGKKGFYPSGELHCEVVEDENKQMILREYMEYGAATKEIVYEDDIAISGYYYDGDGVKQAISEKELYEMNDECEYYRW